MPTLAANEVDRLDVREGFHDACATGHANQVERGTVLEGAGRQDAEAAVAHDREHGLRDDVGFRLRNLLGAESEGGVPSRLKTSNGPVKSSCVIPGKITKPTLKSVMQFSPKDRECRLGAVEIIVPSYAVRNGVKSRSSQMTASRLMSATQVSRPSFLLRCEVSIR